MISSSIQPLSNLLLPVLFFDCFNVNNILSLLQLELLSSFQVIHFKLNLDVLNRLNQIHQLHIIMIIVMIIIIMDLGLEQNDL